MGNAMVALKTADEVKAVKDESFPLFVGYAVRERSPVL